MAKELIGAVKEVAEVSTGRRPKDEVGAPRAVIFTGGVVEGKRTGICRR